MRLSEVRESIEKQKGGVPVYIGDATFFAKRWGTPESVKVRRDLERELFGPFHKKQESDDNLLIAHWLVEYGLTGWEDVQDDKGNNLKYSKDIARKILLNPEYFLSLNSLIFLACNNFENYLFDEAEGDLEAVKKP